MVPHCGSCLISVFPTLCALFSPDVSSDSHIARLFLHPSCRAHLLATLSQDSALTSLSHPSTHTRSESCARSLLHLESDKHAQEARNIDVLGFHPLPRGPAICRDYLFERRARQEQGYPASTSRRPLESFSHRLLSTCASARRSCFFVAI